MSSVQTRRTLVGAAVAALLLVAACSSGGNKEATTANQPAAPQGTSSTTSRSTSTSTSSTADAAQPTKPAASYGVGSRTLHLVDTSRPTKASPKRHIPASNSRKLDVLVLYPIADTAGGTKAVPDAPVAKGRFPLVEFSHGVTASGPAYQPFLEPIASAGYVIVAPTFPLTNGQGAWTDLGDYVNQPADVSFVLTEVLALGTKAGDPLDGHLASHEVAAAGHSLGAITTLGFANSCCEDKRIKAMIEISGVELPYPKGTFTHPPKSLPTLLIHGVVDNTVPYKGSTQAFANLASPRAFLTYPKAGHVDPVSAPAYAPLTVKTIDAFLALELRHDDTAWRALPAKPSVGSFQVAGGLAAPG